MAGAGEDGITYPRAVSLLGATEVALIDDTVDAYLLQGTMPADGVLCQ